MDESQRTPVTTFSASGLKTRSCLNGEPSLSGGWVTPDVQGETQVLTALVAQPVEP